jgi:hypothetical protein
MSDRRVVMGLLLALASGHALPAQESVPAMQARLARLKARGDSLRAEARAQEMAARDSNLTVVVRVGTATMRTTPAIERPATEALTTATAQVRQYMGLTADSLAGRLRFAVREEHFPYAWRWRLFGRSSAARKDAKPSGAVLSASLDILDYSGMSLDWPIDRTELSNGLVTAFERAAGAQLSAPLDGWLNHRVPMRSDSAAFWTDLYRSLATSNAAVNRRCIGGDRDACRLALAIDSLPKDRLGAWYDESDFSGLALTAGDPFNRGEIGRLLTTDEQEQCTRDARIDICRRMLALLPPNAFRIPVSDAGRGALFRIAIQQGGAGAYARVLASTAPTVGERLSAAAQLPADSMVGIWQAKVMAARPHSPLPNAAFFLASTACIVVCGTWAARGQPWK